MASSLAFDQAVPYYDQTRVDPPWVMDAIADSILREAQLSRASRVLEIGVGTGRIALPVLAHGAPVVGIDLSRAMMGELQKKIAGQHTRVALAQADANHLPFADGLFDCIYAVHVYHLVANWQDALRQALRVLARGGTLLISYHDRRTDSSNRRLRDKLAELIQPFGIDTRRPGAQSSEELKAELDTLGGSRIVHVATWQESSTVAQTLDDLAARIFSETWAIPPDVMAKIMPSLRAWAQQEFGDLARVIADESRFNWLVARKKRETIF
jgi:ubiquinone/menaquinone biosynthesis C-methylase UbiE